MPNDSRILLRDIWPIENVTDYKVHFGRWNGDTHPLDAWVRNPAEWEGWQQSRPGRADVWNRKFIFSLMQFYDEQDKWLFGGVFRVTARHADRYEVRLTEQGKHYIGRLKLHSPYRERATRVLFENHYKNFEVHEILPEPYSGASFPGDGNIDVSFGELEAVMRNNRPDWMAALQSVKGVYLITDVNTNKQYVGAAYSDEGIWSRWRHYIETGHGWNTELRALLRGNNLAYCRANFRFSLLESYSLRTPDDTIREREGYWKQVLRTREHGYNRN